MGSRFHFAAPNRFLPPGAAAVGIMSKNVVRYKFWAVVLVGTICVLTILHSMTASTFRRRSHEESWYSEASVVKVCPLQKHESPPVTSVESLIKAMRAKSRQAAAASTTETFFSASKRREWHRKNPCQSRDQMRVLYMLRKVTPDVDENPKWKLVLKEYEILHHTCVRRMGNVTEFFLKKKTIEGCNFVVADTERGTGIGNKLLSIVSIFLYALLTQRVMLVPFATAIPGVMCEPFEGSSWVIDPELRNFTQARENPKLWGTVSKFHQNVDSCFSDDHAAAELRSSSWNMKLFNRDSSTGHDSSAGGELQMNKSRAAASGKNPAVKKIYASRVSEVWDGQPHPRFFCDTEQAHYSRGVTWVYFRESLYFVPKLFAIPSFRAVMEELFPDRYVLPHVLRSVMLPSDAVWGRVRQVHDAYFRHAETRVGIQVRYFHGLSDFELLHQVTENSIQRCLVEHKLLPDPSPKRNHNSHLHHLLQLRSNKASETQSLNVTTVFIASLYQSLNEKLKNLYLRSALETGDAIGIVQLSHENRQLFGLEVDRQALTEILCLSLSDHLLLTPQSTFGALAQGYGGLRPWFTDIRPHTFTACVRAQSMETCYQLPNTKKFSCPHDLQVHGKDVSQLVPYITDCHLVEEPVFKVRGAGLGMQLLTAHDHSNNKRDAASNL
jgi:xyloglucan fucosyltransferase